MSPDFLEVCLMRYIFFLLVITFSLALSACGRMNAPMPPEASIYKRTYY